MEARNMKEMLGDRLVELVCSRTSEWNRKTQKACCLYHSEKTPSFQYYSSNFTFKCFGCGVSMDVYDYIQDFELCIDKNEKGSFAKAAQWLADYLGVDYSKPEGNITYGSNAKKRSSNMNPPIEKKPAFELKSKAGREYAMPGLEEKRVSVELVEYLDTRGISEKTIAHFGLTGNSTRMWFNICDEKGILRNCKGRNIGDFVENKDRGFSQTKGAMPALFGMDLIKKFDAPLYITEGEIDAMSLYEAGIESVVSIPAGSSNSTWIDSCWEWLQKFPGYVIWGDMDTSGEKFRRETCKRLDEEKCQYVEYDVKGYKEFKDANGILKKQGVQKLLQIMEQCTRRYPIEGGIFMSDVKEVDDLDFSENVPTGIWGIDEILVDPRLGQTILVSGEAGTGKSTFLNQISLNAIADGRKVMMYSGEMPAHRIKQWLFNQAAQDRRYITTTEMKYERLSHYPHRNMIPFIEKHINQNFVLFDNNVMAKEDAPKILDILEGFVKKHGVQVLIIDNLLTSDFHRYGPPGNENAQESGFMKAVVNLALRMNVLIYVVAHPRKRGAGASKVIDADEIGGSGKKKDLVQTVMFLYRDPDDESVTFCKIPKNREFGVTGIASMMFDPYTRQYICSKKGKRDAYPWVRQYEGVLQQVKERAARQGKLMGGK